MTYYLIEVSEKKVAYTISAAVMKGNIVYYNPFTGVIDVRYINNNIENHSYNKKRNTANPKNVIFILHLMGFELKYDPETKFVQVKLPDDKEKNIDIQFVYTKYFLDDSAFLSLSTLFPAENLSPLKYQYAYYISNYGTDLITPHTPNVLDNLVLPNLVIPVPDTKI